MPETVLITGGAGLIGRLAAYRLIERSETVSILDSPAERALRLARAMGRPNSALEAAGKAWLGHIRRRAPELSFRERLAELAAWVAEQRAVDRVAEARGKLERRGLLA